MGVEQFSYLIEEARWDIPEIERVSCELVEIYNSLIKPLELGTWPVIANSQLRKVIRNQLLGPVRFTGLGFDMEFYGFGHQPTPRLGYRRVTWTLKEPRFTLRDDRLKTTAPVWYEMVQQASEQVAGVMEQRGLRVSRQPYQFVFPKEEYALSVRVEPGKMLIATP